VAFGDVPRTARGHLGLLFYEAALLVVAHVRARARRNGHAAAAVFEQFPSLHDYASEVERRIAADPGDPTAAAAPAVWLRRQVERWEADVPAGAGGDVLPMTALIEELGISRDARLMLVALGLVEEDAAFAALLAALQAPLGLRRPTLGLLRELVQDLPSAGGLDAWMLCRPLVDAGFAEVVNSDAPRSEWMLRVPPPVWTAIRGDRPGEPIVGLGYRPPDAATPLDELIVSDHQLDRLRHVRQLVAEQRVRTIIVRGTAGSERLDIVSALAAETGRGVLEAMAIASPRDERLPRLGPLATLMRAMPVFCPELGPSETLMIPPILGYAGPVAVVLGREGGVSGGGDAVTIEVEPDAAAYRLRHWTKALGAHASEELSLIAETFTVSGRYIRQCAPMAVACAALEGRQTVAVTDVRQASRAVNRQVLESLATPLKEGGGWEQLVIATSTETDLHDLERRCRHREQLARSVGSDFPGGVTRGVRALFEGPSGTGKTLAARVVAAEVGLDLYRVDLASVINKYIGETEKNLSRILSRAEDLDVILLLDEGDALLSRRTDVRSANDRYANLETNYLLQRLETYDGIVIVTTNLGAQIDPAFRRRMDIVTRFHLPDAEQRWRLWQLHLPADHVLDAATLEEVSLRYALTGGQVRNAALYAAVGAIARQERVGRQDLYAAIELEHRKAGASFHKDTRESSRKVEHDVNRFVSAIS
jgi:hypothetical protein